MNHTYSDKKSVSYISSVALLVYSVGALIGSILCVAAKKKTTASIFFALSGVTAAMGGLVMYTLRAQDRSVQFRCPEDYFENFDDMCDAHEFDKFEKYDEDESADQYVIPVDDTVNEDEFKN